MRTAMAKACRDGLSGIFCNMSLGVILRVLDGEMDQFMPKNSYKVPARRSSERTRLIFLDAAEKIFSERGYEGTTIRAICEAAEVQLGALSYYWGSKSTMFQDVAERRLRPIMEERLERMDAVAVGHAQDEADRQADEIGKERGDERHVNGLPDTELQDAVLPEFDEQIRHDFNPPVDKRCGYGRASAAHRGTAAGRRAGR